MNEVKCPKCGSKLLKRTVRSYIKRTISGTTGIATGFTLGAAGTLFTMGKAADTIFKTISGNVIKPITDLAWHEYECKFCGHIFKVKPE